MELNTSTDFLNIDFMELDCLAIDDRIEFLNLLFQNLQKLRNDYRFNYQYQQCAIKSLGNLFKEYINENDNDNNDKIMATFFQENSDLGFYNFLEADIKSHIMNYFIDHADKMTHQCGFNIVFGSDAFLSYDFNYDMTYIIDSLKKSEFFDYDSFIENRCYDLSYLNIKKDANINNIIKSYEEIFQFGPYNNKYECDQLTKDSSDLIKVINTFSQSKEVFEHFKEKIELYLYNKSEYLKLFEYSLDNTQDFLSFSNDKKMKENSYNNLVFLIENLIQFEGFNKFFNLEGKERLKKTIEQYNFPNIAALVEKDILLSLVTEEVNVKNHKKRI